MGTVIHTVGTLCVYKLRHLAAQPSQIGKRGHFNFSRCTIHNMDSRISVYSTRYASICNLEMEDQDERNIDQMSLGSV